MEENLKEEGEEMVTMSYEEAVAAGLLPAPSKPMHRHTQIFDSEISVETVQNLINELNNYGKVDLFFSTNGGQMVAMEALLHYLNERKEDITIILTDEICSAGTFLLTDFQGCLKLSKGLDFILFHIGDRMTYANRKGDLSRKDLLAQLKELNEELARKFSALGLNSKELKKFKAGYDVILYRKDFHRLNICCNE